MSRVESLPVSYPGDTEYALLERYFNDDDLEIVEEVIRGPQDRRVRANGLAFADINTHINVKQGEREPISLSKELLDILEQLAIARTTVLSYTKNIASGRWQPDRKAFIELSLELDKLSPEIVQGRQYTRAAIKLTITEHQGGRILNRSKPVKKVRESSMVLDSLGPHFTEGIAASSKATKYSINHKPQIFKFLREFRAAVDEALQAA